MQHRDESTYDRVSDAADEAYRSALDSGSRALGHAESGLDSAIAFVRDHPVLVTAVAVAVGASIAAMLPAARRGIGLVGEEHEIMGSSAPPLPPEEVTV